MGSCSLLMRKEGGASEQGPWVLTRKTFVQRASPCHMRGNKQGPWARQSLSTVHTMSRMQASTVPWAHIRKRLGPLSLPPWVGLMQVCRADVTSVLALFIQQSMQERGGGPWVLNLCKPNDTTSSEEERSWTFDL